MIALFFGIIKGVIISVLLLIGCVLLGKAINKRFSLKIFHYLVVFVVALVTCILIISYSLTSSLKSTVEKYGSLAIKITTLPTGMNLEVLTSNVARGEDFIEYVSKEIGKEYPLISGHLEKVTKGNKKLQSQVNEILASNSADKTTQIINSIVTSSYQGIVDKFFWLKVKLFIGIILVQLIQFGMVFVAASQSARRSVYYDNFDFTT